MEQIYKLRIANLNDLPSIVEIYNQAIREKFCTADTALISVESKIAWFEQHKPEKYPIIICEVDSNVVAWLSISPYREGREALRFTVEISYYVDSEYRRKGIAEALLKKSFELAKNIGYKSVFTIILDKNIASIGLMNKLGFVEWANMPNIADFDGIECGHVYFGKRL